MMSKIKEYYLLLDKNQRHQLNYAFENGVSQMVRLGDQFIGVNIVASQTIIIEEEMNHWSVGRLIQDSGLRTQD